VVSLVAALGLLLFGGVRVAAMESEAVACDGISRVQTYRGWGPALHYGETVTVAFSDGDCSAQLGGDTFSISLDGSATLFAAQSAAGEPLEVRSFVAEGSWSDPNGAGWPPPWWSCVDQASLRWEIPGVYTFLVSASGGTWTLNVSPGNVRWTHAAC
jgi:hypothetical protein